MKFECLTNYNPKTMFGTGELCLMIICLSTKFDNSCSSPSFCLCQCCVLAYWLKMYLPMQGTSQGFCCFWDSIRIFVWCLRIHVQAKHGICLPTLHQPVFLRRRHGRWHFSLLFRVYHVYEVPFWAVLFLKFVMFLFWAKWNGIILFFST